MSTAYLAERQNIDIRQRYTAKHLGSNGLAPTADQYTEGLQPPTDPQVTSRREEGKAQFARPLPPLPCPARLHPCGDPPTRTVVRRSPTAPSQGRNAGEDRTHAAAAAIFTGGHDGWVRHQNRMGRAASSLDAIVDGRGGQDEDVCETCRRPPRMRQRGAKDLVTPRRHSIHARMLM